MKRTRSSGRRGRRWLALAALASLAGAAEADAADLLRIRAAPDGTLWAVGARGTVRELDSNGGARPVAPTPPGDAWNDVCFATPEIGWVVGLDGKILETRDGGDSWSVQTVTDERHLFALGCAPGPVAVAVGDWGVILLSHGEATWDDRTLAEDVVLYGAAISAGAIVIVGEAGAILRAPDSRGAFARVASPVSRSLFDVAVDASGRGIAVGLEGVIVVTGDAGRSWREVPSPVRESLYGVALDGSHGVAVGDLGVVLRTDDAGASWTPAAASPGRPLGFFHGVVLRGGVAIAVGAAGAIVPLR